MKQEKKTFCRVCEPACGMIAVVEDGEMTALKPDRDHPVTKGFVCHKGIYGLDIHNDPDRLKVPLKRNASGDFEESTWDVVLPEIASRLKTIHETHGRSAIGGYRGNPMAFNTLFGPSYGVLMGQLGVTKHFSSGTQDCTNKFAGSGAVFGTQTLHPVPDIDHTDFLLLLGENPAISHMSFLSIADPMGEIRRASERGAKVLYVNPRTIESARFAGDVLLIRPDTDVYFLAALLCEIDRQDLIDQDALKTHGQHWQEMLAFVRDYPADRVASVTGIAEETIIDLARQFATAPTASIHMSTGVNMGRQGTLAYWLVHMVSLASGNLGKKGGNLYSTGFYTRASKAGTTRADLDDIIEGPHGTMRAVNSPLIGLPANLMPEYITDPTDPIKAMFITGGNPVLSVAGEEKMQAALASLDLLVCVDIYRNASATHADYVLPVAGAFERPDINLTALGLQHQSSIQYTDAVVEPGFERKPEWWIFEKIAQQMGLKSRFDADGPDTMEADLWARTDAMLRSRDRSMAELQEKGALVFDDTPPEETFDHVQTETGLVECFPAAFASSLTRMEKIFTELKQENKDQLKLITKRDAHMMNSWYANVEKMKRKERANNYLFMHPDDAENRQLKDGQTVSLKSDSGAVDIVLKLADDLMPGVVAVTHGWGHQSSKGMAFAQSTPGVNVNQLLPSGPDSFEPLSNQAHMTGISVEVRGL